MALPLVPVILAILAALARVIGYAVVAGLLKLLVGAGVGVVAYSGVDLLLDQVGGWVRSQMGAIGAAAQILGLAGFDVAINMTLSALAIAFSLRAVSGVMSRVHVSPGAGGAG